MREASLWSPLRVPTFRNLLIADVLSDIGTFMQSVGAGWLMVSFGAGPMYVALTQTASSLPFFVVALPAGSVGDIVDRRKLILFTEVWMTGIATLLAALTIAGAMTPWLLLVFTFAISAGDAFETPTWRAILPELVPRPSGPSAVVDQSNARMRSPISPPPLSTDSINASCCDSMSGSAHSVSTPLDVSPNAARGAQSRRLLQKILRVP
jgi:MFS family permease